MRTLPAPPSAPAGPLWGARRPRDRKPHPSTRTDPAMRWAKSEYILKGVFLGLLLFVSLQKGLDWEATGRVALWLVGGFLVALVLAAARQLRDIKGLGRNPAGFVLFLL